VIPGPRPAKVSDRPPAGREDARRTLRPAVDSETPGADSPEPVEQPRPDGPTVALTRTARGWVVVSPSGTEEVGDLVEGLSLADLVAEELGAPSEPDRTARRSARGPVDPSADAGDAIDLRIAALRRTVTQLEHALSARVATERAIGVLAERHGTSPRVAFEALRRDARSHGRAVVELAHEVLDTLPADTPGAPEQASSPAPETGGRAVPAAGAPRHRSVVASVPPAPRAVDAGSPSTVAAADGRS
jgi:hypothetical protein